MSVNVAPLTRLRIKYIILSNVFANYIFFTLHCFFNVYSICILSSRSIKLFPFIGEGKSQ